MAELAYCQADLAMAQDEFASSMAEMGNSQAHFMDEINQPLQEEPNLEDDICELANLMVELAKSQAELVKSQVKLVDETMEILQIQSEQLERLEVQMGKMAKIISREQERNLPTFEEPVRKEEDAKEMKELVAKEKESTSLEPNEMSEEVVETIPKMTLWGEVHKELKNEKMTPISEVDEFIIRLNKKLKENIVQKEKKYLRVQLEDNVFKLLIEHNYRFLRMDVGGYHHSFHSSMS